MKPTDIQLGDWFRIRYQNAENQTVTTNFQVSQAIKFKVTGSTYVWSDENGNMGDIEKIEPIPLTDVILKKNGFDCSDPEVKQYHFVEDGRGYHFSLRQMYNRKKENDGYSFYAFNVLSLVIYVHELQHAFRVCGIEKEIVI